MTGDTVDVLARDGGNQTTGVNDERDVNMIVGQLNTRFGDRGVA